MKNGSIFDGIRSAHYIGTVSGIITRLITITNHEIKYHGMLTMSLTTTTVDVYLARKIQLLARVNAEW